MFNKEFETNPKHLHLFFFVCFVFFPFVEFLSVASEVPINLSCPAAIHPVLSLSGALRGHRRLRNGVGADLPSRELRCAPTAAAAAVLPLGHGAHPAPAAQDRTVWGLLLVLPLLPVREWGRWGVGGVVVVRCPSLHLCVVGESLLKGLANGRKSLF